MKECSTEFLASIPFALYRIHVCLKFRTFRKKLTNSGPT
ncbi:hypothetical protein LEP1GSC172_2907 [Leptospira noguchii]|uniref:Uncharacterized protein n=1 Tax=Leptospira noguchii TaxID=28182 RepID=M6VU23_9LEPT|nr:hypothetical protein LEP1GSC172_2907 [Leptospira noguchii]